MAISVWAAKTKKQVDGDAEAPPSKVMCSHFELLHTVSALKDESQTMLQPSQHIVNTLAGESGEMTIRSLQAWFQDYVAKWRAMGVTVMFKDIDSTVACFKY